MAGLAAHLLGALLLLITLVTPLELRLVLLEPLRVELQRLGAAVLPPVVNGDADAARLLFVDARLLELLQRAARLPLQPSVLPFNCLLAVVAAN